MSGTIGPEGDEPEVLQGAVGHAVAREFPGLRLMYARVPARAVASPVSLRRRLDALSNGSRGVGVVALRTHAVPQAYRAFFRQIGLDPDTIRPPREQAAIDRLIRGRYEPEGLPHDALLVALLETGVATWALDAGCVGDDGLIVRTSAEGEEFESTGVIRSLPAGRLVVADAHRLHALLFGPVAPGSAVTRKTGTAVLFTIGVEGVPDVHLLESLWIAADLMRH